MKIKSLLLATAVASTTFVACNQFKVTTTEDGSRIQTHEKGETGRLPKEGEILTFELVIKTPTDSVLKSTYMEGSPVMLMAQKAGFKGSFERALFNIGEGDSTTVFIAADSLFVGQPALPPGITKGSDLKFIVRMLKIQSEAEVNASLEEAKNGEGKVIEEYVAKSMKGATRTEEGIYFITQKEGTGATAQSGQTVVVEYTGKFMNGETFDSSVGKEPISVPLGQNYVIPGWEIMMLKMKKGQKATVLIPSALAYGANGAGNVIKPYTPILFDVEIIDIKSK